MNYRKVNPGSGLLLHGLDSVKVDGHPNGGVWFEPLELLRLLSRDFAPMNLICDRGQIFERLIYDRSKAVFEHFACRSIRH
jgi:hypothetical protein